MTQPFAPPAYLDTERLYTVIGRVCSSFEGEPAPFKVFKAGSKSRQYPAHASRQFIYDTFVTYALIQVDHGKMRWYAMICADREHYIRAYEDFVWGRWARSISALKASLVMAPVAPYWPSMLGRIPENGGLTHIPLRYRNGTP